MMLWQRYSERHIDVGRVFNWFTASFSLHNENLYCINALISTKILECEFISDEYDSMELEDIIPEKPTFTLSKSGKTYELRPVNLEDQVWLKNKYGSKEVFEEVLRTQQWEKALLMVYRLLVDKTDFIAVHAEEPDDDGIIQKVIISGPILLMRAMTGPEEGAMVMGALARSIMISNPLIAKAVEKEMKDSLKKNLSTGQKSSTSSRRSMAGSRSKSAS